MTLLVKPGAVPKLFRDVGSDEWNRNERGEGQKRMEGWPRERERDVRGEQGTHGFLFKDYQT